MSNGTPREWRKLDGWKHGKAAVEMRCPQCTGRQVEWVENVLRDCQRCDGRGWVAVPDKGAIVRDAIIGSLLIFCAIVGAAVWLS